MVYSWCFTYFLLIKHVLDHSQVTDNLLFYITDKQSLFGINSVKSVHVECFVNKSGDFCLKKDPKVGRWNICTPLFYYSNTALLLALIDSEMFNSQSKLRRRNNNFTCTLCTRKRVPESALKPIELSTRRINCRGHNPDCSINILTTWTQVTVSKTFFDGPDHKQTLSDPLRRKGIVRVRQCKIETSKTLKLKFKTLMRAQLTVIDYSLTPYFALVTRRTMLLDRTRANYRLIHIFIIPRSPAHSIPSFNDAKHTVHSRQRFPLYPSQNVVTNMSSHISSLTWDAGCTHFALCLRQNCVECSQCERINVGGEVCDFSCTSEPRFMTLRPSGHLRVQSVLHFEEEINRSTGTHK
ncbi:hypothetical protein WN51_12868 [Melipona quadrifasciata]|uniref:Uncharacterized protein n=1 Tax=Melipona quadrifasciata TaxID=166423 RepID=A0A0N0BGW9_9HYME|nr:hypothetical protein WN51_12868 [Melipona quadrifasciata]